MKSSAFLEEIITFFNSFFSQKNQQQNLKPIKSKQGRNNFDSINNSKSERGAMSHPTFVSYAKGIEIYLKVLKGNKKHEGAY